MLKISEAASLGMHAMAVLASRPEGPVSTAELASALEVSEAHLAKVMQRLGRAGLVRSVRGPKGGFELPDGRREVTLLDVYEAVDGPLRPDACLLGRKRCRGRKCMLGDLVRSVNGDVRKRLAGTKVGELTEAFRTGKGHEAKDRQDR